uniref:Uncharacterized protein n=1 Tax=Steinernema glaseri TaxID=37863 RepID=A0A1I7Y3K4_9BILA
MDTLDWSITAWKTEANITGQWCRIRRRSGDATGRTGRLSDQRWRGKPTSEPLRQTVTAIRRPSPSRRNRDFDDDDDVKRKTCVIQKNAARLAESEPG